MGWNTFPLTSNYAADQASPIAAVSRMPGTMELWWIAGDGSVQGASWYEGGDWQLYAEPLVKAGIAAVQGGIAAVSRIPNSMELWFVGVDGSVWDCNWYEGSGWNSFQLPSTGTAATTYGGMAAVARDSTIMDVFVGGSDGNMMNFTWLGDANNGQGEWVPTVIPTPVKVSGYSIAAVTRDPSSVDVFYVGEDQSVRGLSRVEGGSWQSYPELLAAPGVASQFGGIAAVSRIPTSMELWFVGADGSIRDCNWYEGDGWASFELATYESALVSTGIGALSRIPGSMEIWYVTQNGSIADWNWYEGGSWNQFQLPGTAWQPVGFAAVSRIPTSMELWFVGADGQIVDENWYEDLPHGGLPISSAPRPIFLPGQ
jgi:fucose-binding lectin